jgi:hypothetical protein
VDRFSTLSTDHLLASRFFIITTDKFPSLPIWQNNLALLRESKKGAFAFKKARLSAKNVDKSGKIVDNRGKMCKSAFKI